MKYIGMIAVLVLSSAAIMAQKEAPQFNTGFNKGDARYTCERNCQKANRWSGWFKTGRWSRECADICERTYAKGVKAAPKKHEPHAQVTTGFEKHEAAAVKDQAVKANK